MGYYIAIGLIAAIALLLFILSFNRIGDWLYAAVKEWKAALLALIIFSTLGIMFLGQQAIGQSAHAISSRISYWSGSRPNETVAQCRMFTRLKADHEKIQPYIDNRALNIHPNPDKYWEICIQAFGQNYWKQDITVNGQSGGKLLCRLYNTSAYVSSKVQTWCDTVFHEPQAAVTSRSYTPRPQSKPL